MNYEHGAYFDMEFLLAACLMDEEERKAVRNVMELKHRQQQEKGREGDERRGRGEKRALEGGEQERREAPPQPQYREAPPQPQYREAPPQPQYREAPPQPQYREAPPTPLPVVKEEAREEEVRVLPEQWQGAKARPSFPCTQCDKTFLLHKYLQAHQKKAGHAPALPASPAPPQEKEWSCSQCQYTGSRERDLRLHVAKKHTETLPRPASPAPAPVNPAPAPSSPPDSLFTSLSSSWSKKKEAAKEVKEEPAEPSLQELTVSGLEAVQEDPDDPPAVGESKDKVEDTTFVSIDTAQPAPPTAPAPGVDTVDISKSKYFKANPQTVQTPVEGKQKEQFGVTDDKLPKGWMVKEIQHEFKSGRKETKRHYLTPDCKALKTGLAVLEYMRLSGRYSAKEIMDYAKYLAVPVNRLEKYMELYL